MAVILAGSIRNGTIFEYEGNIFKVTEFLHVKPGKGSAFVRAKIKNIKTGGTIEKTFNPSEKLEGVELEYQEMQYLYTDGEFYHFMDVKTYDQVALTEEQVGDAIKYIKENMNIKVMSYKGEILSVDPPMFVELQVTYTEPGFAGNTSTTSGKPATLENGLEVSVPLFVEIDDIIKIDTRTGEYVERVNK